MADIFVYAPNCVDFDTLGECGPLECTAAKFTEEANGLSELTIEHPIDDIGRWSFLAEDYILQASVPVRSTPEIKDGAYVVSTQIWRAKTTATKNQRGIYSKSSGGKRYDYFPVWDDRKKTKRHTFRVVDMQGSRYKIKYKKGYGWVNISAIEYVLTPEDLEASDEAIELADPSWSIRPQLFRMYAPEVGNDKVTVKARHITYDLLGNSTTYTADNPTCMAALGTNYGALDAQGKLIPGILNSCIKPHDIVGQTNVLDQRVIADWKDVSPLEAILGTEKGLLAAWGVDLIRDNETITILHDAGLNRGVRIEWAKNLTGVKVSLDTSALITSIKPIGLTNKGKPLYLAPGTYTVDGEQVVIDNSLTVSSPEESKYPTPHVYLYNLGNEAKATDSHAHDVLAARVKMIKACKDLFKNQKCDIPLLNLKVEFVSLGDTEEGAQYKQLENVYLFDRVTVWHPKINVDVLTSVRRMEFDPVLERFLSIELGSVRRNPMEKKIPSWKLPPATEVAYGAVGPGAFDESVPNALDLTNNETVRAVAQQYVKNAWITGEQAFKYTSGSMTPSPESVLIYANIQNVIMDHWEYKDSSGNWQPYPVGDGNATNTATVLVVKPGHSVWVNALCTVRLITDDASIMDTYNLHKIYDGTNGVDGSDGVNGAPGADGQSYYTWIRYADDASGTGMSDNPEGKSYIGIAPNKTIATESSNPADYAWALIKGEDGVPGAPGADGITYYTWIKYADSATGSGISDSPTGKTYIGVASNKTTATESSNPADYVWALIKGADGVPGTNGQDGLHGLTAILSNAAHTLPKATNGTISYTGSGTALHIFEGINELVYDGVGASNGTWKVTPVANGIACGSLTDSGNYLTVGDHGAMTGNTASVTFNVTGKRANGTAISFAVTQTLSIAQPGDIGPQGNTGATGATGPQGNPGADAAIISPTLPSNPTVGQLIAYTGVDPNELIRWTGKGVNPTQRRYPVLKQGEVVKIEDFSDDRSMDVVVVTNARRPAGTPTLTDPHGISGYPVITVRRHAKNGWYNSGLRDNADGWTFSTGLSRWPSLKYYDDVCINCYVTGLSTDEYREACLSDGYWKRVTYGDVISASVEVYIDDYTTFGGQDIAIEVFAYDISGNRLFPSIAGMAFTPNITHNKSWTRIEAHGTVDRANIAYASPHIWVRRNGQCLIARPQLEYGVSCTDYEVYSGADYVFTPSSPLFGIPATADSVDNNGLVVHNTGYVTLDGNYSWEESTGNDSTNTKMYAAIIQYTQSTEGGLLPNGCISNRFVDVGADAFAGGAYADAGSVCAVWRHAGTNAYRIFVRVPRSLCADIAAWKTWLNSNPLQIVFKLEVPVIENLKPLNVVGANGFNVVSSEGVLYPLEYTGSGWEAVSGMRRMTVESVSISPEEGLRVDTLLTNGGTAVPTFFNARGTKYGLFRTADGKLLQGAKVLADGTPVAVTGAIVDPDTDDFLIRVQGYQRGSNTTGLGLVFEDAEKRYMRICSERYQSAGEWIDYTSVLDGLGDDVEIRTGTQPDAQMFNLIEAALQLNPQYGQAGLIGRNYTSGNLSASIVADPKGYNNLPAIKTKGRLWPEADETDSIGTPSKRYVNIYASSGTVNPSDIREKHDIESLDRAMMRRFISLLNPSWFRRNSMPDSRMTGFIAQEFREAMRDAGLPDDYGGFVDELPDHSRLALRYDQVIAPLVSVEQQHDERLEEHEQKIKERDRTIEEQGRQIEELKRLVEGLVKPTA